MKKKCKKKKCKKKKWDAGWYCPKCKVYPTNYYYVQQARLMKQWEHRVDRTDTFHDMAGVCLCSRCYSSLILMEK